MKTYRLTYPIKENNFEENIVAIGFFDGLHLGHQKVIKRACEKAKSENLPCAVMTFNPHPREVMGLKEKIDQITPLETKLMLFEELGVDISYVVHFTKEFAAISPKEFVEKFLMQLQVKGVVVGFDFTYGHKGKGTAEALKEDSIGRFSVDIVSPYFDHGEKVSSTRVRDSLLSGNTDDVKRLLGRNYTFLGKVVHGDKRGRTIGFPTANLALMEEYLKIKNGVYAVKVNYQNQIYIGVMNVGFKPTFTEDVKTPTYEVYMIDFHDEIYNQILEVEILDYIRDERKFNSIDELVTQIEKDVNDVSQLMKRIML